ncbi:MAG: UDP-N-acetylglucosamine 1-carboxyvinyltransferase [Oscillospiraceae bacterium]|nr:UDP-N-acetylglucosamine 1-carboxyvinyltransferase [Oscillospiraceae bacterium]
MAQYIIQGGRRLEGEHWVQGAKNSALPILAAAAATKSQCVIHRCPALKDVDAALRILRWLGCGVRREGGTVTVDAAGLSHSRIPEVLMREMRSSIIFMGPLLSALGHAELSAPGGCEIGLRPINLHLEAMRALGAEIVDEGGRLSCSAAKGLHGGRYILSFPSVGATENMMIAAARARGTTTLTNAAREPEIVDLANFLNRCGANVRGAGEGVITIEGVESLHGAEHAVIPDRIAAVTMLSAAAITRGEILLRGAAPGHMDAVLSVLEQGGCRIRRAPDGEMHLRACARLRHFPTVRTMPYPGFPTDAQAAIMALACVAEGASMITETIFENRYNHVGELRRMGASIRVEDRVAVVEGVACLHGAGVEARDLRAGTALVVAGLAAEGRTRVRGVCHMERGCERFEEALAALGADINRMEEDSDGKEANEDKGEKK